MSSAQRRPPRFRTLAVALGLLIGVLAGAALVWREDIQRTLLDPRTPYQVYLPPPAPDYARAQAWALLPAQPDRAASGEPAMDVFFVHPTTYDGGRHWNAPVDDPGARRLLEQVMLPNYAGPYQQVARVFAPRYRQASLYTRLTLRDDARSARAFAYEDVRRAFRAYLARWNGGRPLLLVGVEQGGELTARLLAEEIGAGSALRARLVGAHLIETVLPEGMEGAPPCSSREQARCMVAYATVRGGDDEAARRRLDRALTWTPGGDLEPLAGRRAVCVNPVLGRATGDLAAAGAHLGGANATGLECGARPGFMPRQATAQCVSGLLQVSRPVSPSLRPVQGWIERRRAPPFNLFYADLEADARARLEALHRPAEAEPASPPALASVSQAPAGDAVD